MAGVSVGRDAHLSNVKTLLVDLERKTGFGPDGISFAKALKDVSVFLGSEAKRSFDNGRSPDGNPWKPLKIQRNRARDKRAKGGTGQKPLRDTDRLMASMGAKAKPPQIRTLGAFHLEQGTNLDYAAIHQYGGTINQPARTAHKDDRGRFASKRKADKQGRKLKEVAIRARTITIPARPFAGISDKAADRIAEIVADNVEQQIRRLLGGG